MSAPTSAEDPHKPKPVTRPKHSAKSLSLSSQCKPESSASTTKFGLPCSRPKKATESRRTSSNRMLQRNEVPHHVWPPTNPQLHSRQKSYDLLKPRSPSRQAAPSEMRPPRKVSEEPRKKVTRLRPPKPRKHLQKPNPNAPLQGKRALKNRTLTEGPRKVSASQANRSFDCDPFASSSQLQQQQAKMHLITEKLEGLLAEKLRVLPKKKRLHRKKSKSLAVSTSQEPPSAETFKDSLRKLQTHLKSAKRLLEPSVKDQAACKIQQWFRTCRPQDPALEVRSYCSGSGSPEDSFNQSSSDLCLEEVPEPNELVEQLRQALFNKQQQLEKLTVVETQEPSPLLEEFYQDSEPSEEPPQLLAVAAVKPEIEYIFTQNPLPVKIPVLDLTNLPSPSISSEEEPQQHFLPQSQCYFSSENSDTISERTQLERDHSTLSAERPDAQLPLFAQNAPSQALFATTEPLPTAFLPPVSPSFSFLYECLKSISKHLMQDENKFLDTINTPMYPNPLQTLSLLQITEIGELLKVPTFDLILTPECLKLLNQQLNPGSLTAQTYYLQMAFDSTNEALNYVRPYSTEGVPPPWSVKNNQILGESSLADIFERVRKHLKQWWNMKGGPLETQETSSERLSTLREARMGLLLSSDIHSGEKNWLDYEDEELQVVMDCSDMVLDYVVEELINILYP